MKSSKNNLEFFSNVKQEFVNMDNKAFKDELEGLGQTPNDEVRPEDAWPDLTEASGDNGKNPESNLAANVNVYDYEVSSFADGQETANPGQEMQERRGSAFLGQTAQSGLISHHSMDQIPEEADEDGKGVNHIENVN